MSENWVLDLLGDLRQYAAKNGHVGLVERLDDALIVAAVELHASARAPDGSGGDILSDGGGGPGGGGKIIPIR